MDLNDYAKQTALGLYGKYQDLKARAGLGLRHAAGQISEDLGKGAAIANDPRNAWIGTNPVGRVGAEGLSLTSALIGMLAGPKAKTANHALLAVAKDLEKEGASNRDIWSKTGWLQGPDGEWRFEISDHAAKLSSNVPRSEYDPSKVTFPLFEGGIFNKNQRTLGSTLDHPALFEAYPELRDVRVGSAGFDPNLRGSYNKSQGYLGLAGGKPDDVLSTALHETQHAVQGIEGTAPGGLPSMFLSGDYDKIRNGLQQKQSALQEALTKDIPGFNYFTLYGALNAKSQGKSLMPYQEQALRDFSSHPKANEFIENMTQLTELRKLSDEAYEKYRALAGEAEARLTQTRQPLTPPERAQTFPYDQFDVPPARQIIKREEQP